VLVHLGSYAARKIDLLDGAATAFSPNGEHILVGTGVFYRSQQHLVILDLDGNMVRQFPLNMVIPRLIAYQGEKVTVTGIGGAPYNRRPVAHRVTQEIDLRTGESATQVDRTRTGREIPNPSSFSELPQPKGKYGQHFTDLFWDESTGIAIICGRGSPEGGVLKAWDIWRGRFIATMIGGEVSEPVGFVRPGVFVAYSWFDRAQLSPNLLVNVPKTNYLTKVRVLTEFDLVNGGRRPVEDLDKNKNPYIHNRHVHDRYATHALAPLSIAGGKLGLQPEGMTLRLHLVTLPEQKTLLTFVPFEKDIWFVHTADGEWNGSDGVRNRVAFYRGPEPLTASAIAGLKRGREIDALLRKYVPGKGKEERIQRTDRR
jgi:hypothetical protein